MKYFIVIFCLVTVSTTAQTVNNYKNNLTVICENYKKNIFEINVCETIANELTILESKIGESLFFDKTLTTDEKANLKNLKSEVVALNHFISYQQACGQDYFTFEELTKASAILGASFLEVFTGKYCMKIIKTELNGFVSYLAENTLNEHRKLNFKFKRIPYGVGQGESAIQAKGIKDIYNNKTEKDIKSIELVYFNCLQQ